jgi:hypothetical protein
MFMQYLLFWLRSACGAAPYFVHAGQLAANHQHAHTPGKPLQAASNRRPEKFIFLLKQEGLRWHFD